MSSSLTAAVLMRDGKRKGNEIVFRCPFPEKHQHEDRTPSAEFNESKKTWHCFGCGSGGDDKSLRAALHIDEDSSGSSINKPSVPLGVPKTWQGCPLTAWWVYKDARGSEIGVVARYDKNGKKQVIPFFKRSGGRFGAGAPVSPGPLFGLDWLAAQPNAPVFVVEGEKCAAALQRLAAVAVTSQGGSSAADKADWSPLRGRTVIVWPDNDEPGAKYASEVRRLVLEAGATEVRQVDVGPLSLGDGGDVVDWLQLNPGAGLSAIGQLVSLDVRPATKLVRLSLAEIMTLEFPPRELVLEPWLRTKDLVMLYAWRGAGKTWVTLSLALAVASGSEFLRWKAPEPRNVLLIDGEMPMETLQVRLAKLIKASTSTQMASLDVIAADYQDCGIPSLVTPRGQELVEEHLSLAPYSLLIIDNVSTLCGGGEENAAESWVPVQEWALKLRRQGIGVIFVHHAGKGGQQRGTSRREDILDTVIALKRPNDYSPVEGARFEIHFEKARGLEGCLVEPFEAKLDDGPDGGAIWTMRSIEAAQDDRIVALYSEEASVSEIAKELGINKSTVSRALRKNGIQVRGRWQGQQ